MTRIEGPVPRVQQPNPRVYHWGEPRRSRPDHGGVELDWLETFLAVVDRGGFTAASAHVHRSQSRVSAHIAALERELGTQLIDRTRRPATLTAAGRIFAGHARDILAEVGSARSAIDVLRAMNSESLAVLTTPCIGAALFPGVIATVLGRHPRARISLSEHGWPDGEPHCRPTGFALAVVPTFTGPPAAEWHSAGALAGTDPGAGAGRPRIGPARGRNRARSSRRLSWPGSRWWPAARRPAPSRRSSRCWRPGDSRSARARWWTPRRRWWPWSGPVSGSASQRRCHRKHRYRRCCRAESGRSGDGQGRRRVLA